MGNVRMPTRRAVSPLVATLILVAITVSAGLLVYAQISGMLSRQHSQIAVHVVSLELHRFEDKVLLMVSVKNTGNRPLAGIIVTGFDDNGKRFSLALPPAEPDATVNNSLIIPLGASNIVLDGSGNNNHVTIHGSPSWVNGKSGKGLDFDDYQTTQYLDVPYTSLDGLSDFTIAFWAYGGGSGEYVISGSDGSNHNYMLMRGPTASGWHFYVWRRGGGYGTHIYKDLVRADSLIYSNPRDPVNLAPGGFIIAQEQDSLGGGFDRSQAFSGKLDEIYIYSEALSDEEMEMLFNGVIVTGNLTLLLPLDEGAFNSFEFAVGNSYPITITAYSLDGDVYTRTVSAVCS